MIYDTYDIGICSLASASALAPSSPIELKPSLISFKVEFWRRASGIMVHTRMRCTGRGTRTYGVRGAMQGTWGAKGAWGTEPAGLEARGASREGHGARVAQGAGHASRKGLGT